jgi:kynurenine formamidase
MNYLDLTLNLDDADDSYKIVDELVPLKSANFEYTAVIHEFSFSSMAGTYIDFPTHIKETDNGDDAANYPIEKLYRRSATTARLDRKNGSGGVGVEELRKALPNGEIKTPVLIVNALGNKRFDDVEWRSVYFTLDAVEWICSSGIEIIISDIYESNNFEGVFINLFRSEISTVCFPVNLHKLPVTCEVTILPLKAPKAVQLPCRVVAEFAVT